MATEDTAAGPAQARPPRRRAAAAAHAAQPALTHDRIAEAALRIADADGVEAVTMRRLALELDVSAMTGYRYIAGKDDVLELMLDRVRTGMLVDDVIGDWRAVLRASALRFREVVLRHPWAADLPGRILLAPTPAYVAMIERNLAALDGQGLAIDQMMDIVGAVTAYARASTHDEIARARLRADGGADAANGPAAAHARLTRLLEAGEYPTYRRYVMAGPSRGDAGTRFAFGLDCLLDGIAARLHLDASR